MNVEKVKLFAGLINNKQLYINFFRSKEDFPNPINPYAFFGSDDMNKLPLQDFAKLYDDIFLKGNYIQS